LIFLEDLGVARGAPPGSREGVLPLAGGLGGTFPAVLDPLSAPNRPGPIAASYGLDTQALPVSVFIDRNGNVHQVYPGRIDAGTIASELHQMGIG